MSVDILCI